MARRLKYLVMLVFLISMTSQRAFASEESRIEQIDAKMPLIKAYLFTSEDLQSKETVQGYLNQQQLTVESLERASNQEAIHYYALVDCSTSTNEAQMEAIRLSLSNLADKMEKSDDLTLLTFGVSVDVLLDKETSKDKILKSLNLLKADQEGTLFFDALAKTAELADEEELAIDRKIIVMFSDAVDVNNGGYTYQEINEQLKKTGLPVYAFGFDSGEKDELDTFGAIARESGGTINIVNETTLEQKFDKMLDDIIKAYVITFQADNNIVPDASSTFRILLMPQKKQVDKEVIIRYREKDELPPKITEASQVSDENLKIVFSENVSGANVPENYVIMTEDQKLIGIKAVAYDEETHAVTLALIEPPKTGELNISCKNIEDISMEKNKVEGKTKVDFQNDELSEEEKQTEKEQQSEQTPVGAWFLLTILFVGIALAVVYKKRKSGKYSEYNAKASINREMEVESACLEEDTMCVHIVEKELPTIIFQISSDNGEAKSVEIPINKTLFVGRSDICNLIIDDIDMSRQHFVIEETDGNYSISNLSETNGTKLNGIFIGKTRALHSGDCIEAGREQFVVKM